MASTAASAPPDRRIRATAASRRFDRVDALRGLAIVWMALFHFCFDLDHFHFIQQNFHADPFWTLQRSAIVSVFLVCAGLGQALSIEAGTSSRRFWRRWSQVAGCALLVSAGSWWMFPNSFISFGVLHGVALMLLLTRGLALARPPAALWWLLGAVALLLPLVVHHPAFDTRWTNWVGLGTRKPVTEDYVPLLPWLGVMCWGVAAGQWLLARRPAWLGGSVAAPLWPLVLLGRHSLSFYMLHQPVLIGLLLVLTMIAPVAGH